MQIQEKAYLNLTAKLDTALHSNSLFKKVGAAVALPFVWLAQTFANAYIRLNNWLASRNIQPPPPNVPNSEEIPASNPVHETVDLDKMALADAAYENPHENISARNSTSLGNIAWVAVNTIPGFAVAKDAAKGLYNWWNGKPA